MACRGMAHIVIACTVIAYAGMAFVVMAYIVMACTVIAYAGMAL